MADTIRQNGTINVISNAKMTLGASGLVPFSYDKILDSWKNGKLTDQECFVPRKALILTESATQKPRSL